MFGCAENGDFLHPQYQRKTYRFKYKIDARSAFKAKLETIDIWNCIMVHTVHTFEVPLYDPVGLVVYWPPRVLEDDIWTEDLMVAPR